MITAQEYQQLAARTLIDAPAREYTAQEIMLVWNAIGLCGELGEVLSAVGDDNLAEEAADFLWYIAALYTKAGFVMPTIETEIDFYSEVAGECAMETEEQLVIAASAIAEAIKKQVFHNHGLNLPSIKILLDTLTDKFLGFCIWNLVDVHAAMESNIAKLQKRYPDGWDAGRSIKQNSSEQAAT